jgi:hypothetical protein
MDHGQGSEESNINTKTMKETLKEMFDSKIDGICFMPEDESHEELSIKTFNYKRKQKGEYTENLGYCYHIILYKSDPYEGIYSEDNFTAILTDPHVYADWVIQCGFYGIISKKTKSSTKFINEVYKKLLEP